MSVHIVNMIWILSNLHPCVSAVVCEGLKGLECCSGFAGYVWNETVHNCTSCISGFQGENCALSCPFPYYGIHCGSKCNCSEDECHHQYGYTRSFGDSSSPAAGPLANTTTAYMYPLNTVNENFNNSNAAAATDQVTDIDLTTRNDGPCGSPEDSNTSVPFSTSPLYWGLLQASNSLLTSGCPTADPLLIRAVIYRYNQNKPDTATVTSDITCLI
ncbi:uncharacterized protein LOC125673283 isoform X1 [Ostrea edulis]|uniref:uncharacterized protein LOC125673283 isoform X1 n=1 Tax=Ostrea edulis TaxID=37623 RepID=UPI0024AFF2AC|nr:uncharacterized protein LOC125673283 isoform X1 [Ostrea edulis]